MTNLPPIDFCVSVQGPMQRDLMRLFLGSLVKHCRTDGVKFHFVNREADKWSADKTYLREIDYTIYDLPIECSDMGSDVSYCANWMVNRIGVNRWVCISHFDMWFKKDWLTYARSHIADDVALIGVHCPIMLVNRKAYARSVVKFNMFSGYYAVPINDGSGHYKVRHELDPRAKGGSPVRGFDNGEMLELEMRSKGWKVLPLNVFNEEPPTEEGHAWFHHIGGGVDTSELQVAAKTELCRSIMVREGY